MEEEIGKTAGAIWDGASTRGRTVLSELKKAVKREGTHPSDWAIGWLRAKNQIAITPEKRSFASGSSSTGKRSERLVG